MYDPQNIILTDVGRQYLLQKKAAGQKARIGSFKLGDMNLFVPSEADINIYGDQVFIGLADEIWCNKYSPNEWIIRCVVGTDKGDFNIGNIGIYSDTNVLLFIARFTYIHRKMRSTENGQSVGGRWTFQLRLTQLNIESVWSFDNLVLRYAAMDEHFLSDVSSPRYPLDSYYSELHLNDSFLPTNRGGYFNISGDISRKWYTSPFQISDAYLTVYETYEIGGGAVGDVHQYQGGV